MRILFKALFILVFLSCHATADVTIADIESALQGEVPADLKRQFGPLLKKYNRDKGNKAIAIGAIASGGYSAGVSYKSGSEFAASNQAMLQCQNWLKENKQQGQCEVLILGEQTIKPGAVLRESVRDATPAMAWKVEGPKGDLYLMGTLHILKATLLPLPTVFDQFFNASDNVVFETNPILMSDPGRQAELSALMLADPASQKKLYNKADRKLLKQFAKSQGLQAEAFYTALPVVSALQATQLKTTAIGYSGQTGVEMHYARRASTTGKPIRELETPAEAMAALFALPEDLQVDLLLETLAELDQVAEGVETIVGNWLQGDADAVYQQSVEDMATAPELEAIATGMLDDRNIRWMTKIDKMLEEESNNVVMVGSAHFGGKNGLLALLRERGFQPVQYSWSGEPLETAQ